MYSPRCTVFFLAFLLALVSAGPLRYHHRRSACHHRYSATASYDTTPTNAAVEIPSYSPSPTPSSPSKASPSKVKTTTSKAPKGTPKPSSSPLPSSDEDDGDSPPTSKPSSSPSSDEDGDDSPPTPKPSSSPSSDEDDGDSPPAKPSGGLLDGLLDQLFPSGDSLASWTTCSSSKNALPLSDSTFRPTNVLQALPHPYVSAPDGKKAMKAHYPKGSYNFGHDPQGGISFYAPGPANVDLTTAKEVTFGYSVYFPKGFVWQKGGKLPGLYGGDDEQGSISCSGGRRSDACFSARLMWRGDGAGELYTYLPPSSSANKKVCNLPPQSDCNPTYGASVARGSFNFQDGDWTTVSQRVKLNDVGEENGELQLFVGGKSVINVSGLVLRTSASGAIRGIQMQTFFGGSSSDFATPIDQDVYFSDFSIAITQKA